LSRLLEDLVLGLIRKSRVMIIRMRQRASRIAINDIRAMREQLAGEREAHGNEPSLD
jgi:hypothetical protein